MTQQLPAFELIPTATAARLLGVTVDTLNRWARAGKIAPAVQGDGLTGARFYVRAEIEALAATATPKVSL